MLAEYSVQAQNAGWGEIAGTIELDSTWERMVYLSHIPRFEDMYRMSSEMIISKATIDDHGEFRFTLDFLPEEDNLFRIHLTKKGDTPASLIIGGKDENHLFLIANRYSQISLQARSVSPPFMDTKFLISSANIVFNSITTTVATANEKASISTSAKRQFIESDLSQELMTIADTCSIPLVSLYAIYKNQVRNDDPYLHKFYLSYLTKWSDQHNRYFDAFRNQIHIKENPATAPILVLTASLITAISVSLFMIRKIRSSGIQKLSVQERKIFELLQKGASNQEISDQYNIGISTVKSHVSNIFGKLKVKSRKEIMNLRK